MREVVGVFGPVDNKTVRATCVIEDCLAAGLLKIFDPQPAPRNGGFVLPLT